MEKQDGRASRLKAMWKDPAARERMLAAFAAGGSRKGAVRTPEQKARIAEGCRRSWASKKRRPYNLSAEGLASGVRRRAAARLARAAERARNNSTEE